jgi:hypothetical protein
VIQIVNSSTTNILVCFDQEFLHSIFFTEVSSEEGACQAPWNLFFVKEARYRPFALCRYLLDRKYPMEKLSSVTTTDCCAYLAAAQASESIPETYRKNRIE